MKNFMGVTTCNKHGIIGIDFACPHITKNILSGEKVSCVRVQLEAYSTDSNHVEELHLNTCINCFTEHKLSKKVKIELTRDELESFGQTEPFCALCIKEYVDSNEISVQ
jgi:hypothetical protein